LTSIGPPRFPLDGAAFLADDSGMIAERIPELKKLSLEEKPILAKELWKEIAASPDSLPARDDHVKLLKERLEHYRKNPADTVAWEQVKAVILSSR
jgi:putative addiction module component (TIGR02574 family)